MGPRARSCELIIRRFGDETVVYDRTTHRAHCLNGTASFVFDRCDGGTSPEELARQLKKELEDPAEAMIAGFVDMALEQLEEAGLLEDIPAPDARDLAARRSRRETLRKLGAAATLPAVLSALVPTPAEAQTCVPRNGSCTSSQQCCPDAPCCRPLGGRPPRCTPGGGNCIP
jgi:PqqD family protein of HPr-rel-A system